MLRLGRYVRLHSLASVYCSVEMWNGIGSARSRPAPCDHARLVGFGSRFFGNQTLRLIETFGRALCITSGRFLQNTDFVMLLLTLAVSVVTFASGRTNVLQGRGCTSFFLRPISF